MMPISDQVKTIVTFEYLKNIPTDQVYMYLKKNAENKRIEESDDDYMKIENLLLTLNDPLIKLGLAQYGYSHDVLVELYTNGNKAIKLAALMNRKDNYHVVDTGNRSWVDRDLIKKIVIADNEDEKYALLSNPLIGANTLEELFEKKQSFESLTESNWQNLLRYVRDNVLLKTSYDNHYADGFTEYSYSCMLRAAWKLADAVPVTKKWAETLWFLLLGAYPEFDIKLVETLKRWESLGDDSADIRMILIRRLNSDEKENYKDSAEDYIRRAYYQSFYTSDPEKLEKLFNKDKELFLDGAICNENLYRDSAIRDKLHSLTLVTENGDLSHYNWFNGELEKYQKEHPEWFEAIADLTDESESEDIRNTNNFEARKFKKLSDIHSLVYLTLLMVVGIVAYLIFK